MAASKITWSSGIGEINLHLRDFCFSKLAGRWCGNSVTAVACRWPGWICLVDVLAGRSGCLFPISARAGQERTVSPGKWGRACAVIHVTGWNPALHLRALLVS